MSGNQWDYTAMEQYWIWLSGVEGIGVKRFYQLMSVYGDARAVWDALGKMDEYLRKEFGLQLNNKTAVMPYDAGVEFVGRIITPDRMTVRKETSLQMKHHLRYVSRAYAEGEVTMEYAISVIRSYLGLLKHTDCEALKESLCSMYVLVRNKRPEEVREMWDDENEYTIETG
jgi:hypothetical protein